MISFMLLEKSYQGVTELNKVVVSTYRVDSKFRTMKVDTRTF